MENKSHSEQDNLSFFKLEPDKYDSQNYEKETYCYKIAGVNDWS